MQGQQRPQSRNVIFAGAVHARLRLLAAASQSGGGRGRGETAGSGCRACPPESDDRHFSTKTAQHSIIHPSIILCTLSPSPMQCRTGLLRSWLRPPAPASTPSLQPPKMTQTRDVALTTCASLMGPHILHMQTPNGRTTASRGRCQDDSPPLAPHVPR